MRETFTFSSFGEVTVNGYKWLPTSVPSKIVVLSHGMAETIERYERFANALTAQGYVVYGHNHRGHGSTAGSLENLGYLGIDGWNRMREDLRSVIEMAKSDYPNTPTYIFAHSMGSFLARDFLIDNSYMIDGIILSGTGFENPAMVKLMGKFAGLVAKVKGQMYRSERINQLAFGKYNERWSPVRTPFDWLSRDEAEVDKYIADPYCGVTHPASFFCEFSIAMHRIFTTDLFNNFKGNLPMLLLSGSQDPVGGYGKGVERAERQYNLLGFQTKMKLYKGARHEILNETVKEEVTQDILEWLDKH